MSPVSAKKAKHSDQGSDEVCIHSLTYLVRGSHRPGKVLELDLGPGKLLEFEKSAFCPGIVMEFCKIILENMN